jgi:hypothetical protein
MLCMSILAFTEVPAAFLIMGFVILALRSGSPRMSSMVPLSLLPWLHLRYSILSLAGFFWALVLVWRHTDKRCRLRSLVCLLPVPILSFALLCLHYWWMFDTWLPYGQFGDSSPLTTLTASRGLAGLMVDRDFGLLTVAPFWAIALVASSRPRFLLPGYVMFACSAFLGSWIVAALNPMWWGGYSPPARFMIPVLPLFVPMLGEGIQRILGSRTHPILFLQLIWASFMTALLINRPMRLWASPQDDLGLLASLPRLHRLLPSLLDPTVSVIALLIVLAVVFLLALPALFSGPRMTHSDQ